MQINCKRIKVFNILSEEFLIIKLIKLLIYYIRVLYLKERKKDKKYKE